MTVTDVEAVATQPLPLLTVTEYTPVVLTEMAAVLAPVDQV